jgi:hypothetical protein
MIFEVGVRIGGVDEKNLPLEIIREFHERRKIPLWMCHLSERHGLRRGHRQS